MSAAPSASPDGSVASNNYAEDDEIVDVQLARSNEGLGLDLDELHDGACAIGSIVLGSAAERDGRLLVGDRITAVNGTPCSTYDNVINAIRAAPSGDAVEFTLSRKRVRQLLEAKLRYKAHDWEEFTFRLFSNRTCTFESTKPPVVTGEIDVRLASLMLVEEREDGGGDLTIRSGGAEVMVDARGDGQPTCASPFNHVLRGPDVTVLHAWRRALRELLPQGPHLPDFAIQQSSDAEAEQPEEQQEERRDDKATEREEGAPSNELRWGAITLMYLAGCVICAVLYLLHRREMYTGYYLVFAPFWVCLPCGAVLWRRQLKRWDARGGAAAGGGKLKSE
jgi:hypothetical protein